MINSNVEISVKQDKQIVFSSQLTPHRYICFHVSLIFKFSELLKLCKYSHICWSFELEEDRVSTYTFCIPYDHSDPSSITFKMKYTKFQWSEK